MFYVTKGPQMAGTWALDKSLKTITWGNVAVDGAKVGCGRVTGSSILRNIVNGAAAREANGRSLTGLHPGRSNWYG